MATLLISGALVIQTLFAYASVSQVAVVEFDVAIYALSLCISTILIGVALWTRFSARKRAAWERNVSAGLFSGLCLLLAILSSTLLSRNAILLTEQPLRHAGLQFATHDVVMILVYSFVFTIAFSQLGNGLLRMRVLNGELEKGQNKLNLILHSTSEAVIAINEKGLITFFNRSAEDMFGWMSHEVLGKNVRLLVTDEHQHRHDMYIHNFIERSSSSVVDTVREVCAKRKDGSTLPIRLSIGHRESGGQHEFVAVISDVSEQRNLAWALRENAKQYRSLVANLPCMAFREMTGASRHIVYISEAAKFMTGFSASVLTGENGVSHFIDRIHKGDTANYRKMREIASRRNGRYDCEYRFMTRDDEQRWFWEIGHTYRAEDGSTWIDGIILDVTEKRESEQELEEKIRLAEKASQSKTSFLANMSYEFRSPMNSILGLTEVLLTEATNPSHRHHLEVIRESGNNLLKLINDIHDTSKLESQSLPLDVSDFSLIQLCRQIEFTAQETVQARDLRVSLHYDDTLWEQYIGDARRIKQLLQNLMRSALTKTESGDVTLHVLPVNDMVRFAVVSCSSLQNGGNATLVKTGQTLSATLVTQLIELMSGHLWFDGENINNSVVYADLPLVPAQSANKLREERVVHYALPPLEVLVIDDVQRNQQELRDMLLRQGVKVLTFTDMESAADVLKTQPVDVVLLDAYLNGKHFPSPDALRGWATHCHNASIRVVAMKLAADPKSEEEWQRLGYDLVIEKPFVCRDVFSVLARCCAADDIVSVSATAVGEEKEYFDDAWAFQHWSTSDILLSVIREFRANYRDLPQVIGRSLEAQPDTLERELKQAKDAAHCIGFQRVEEVISHILGDVAAGDVAKAESRLTQLDQCLNTTFDRALAYLGVRGQELDDDVKGMEMSPDAFAHKTEQFVSMLSDGQYDDKLYRELMPMMARFVPPPLLGEFVEAVENFELDKAYLLILSAMEQMPMSQNSGVQRYGV